MDDPVLDIMAEPGQLTTTRTAGVDDYLARRRIALDAGLADLDRQHGTIAAAADWIARVLRGGGKVLVAGNGGSAAESQHLAAELVGRFKRERPAYAVTALTADTAILTAIANDYGFEHVFARQVEALGRPGDLLIALSTSGTSANVVEAARVARCRDVGVIAITGPEASPLARVADLVIATAGADAATIQEIHMVLTHLLCDMVEAELSRGIAGC